LINFSWKPKRAAICWDRGPFLWLGICAELWGLFASRLAPTIWNAFPC